MHLPLASDTKVTGPPPPPPVPPVPVERPRAVAA
jgi:hypothetical protein